MANRRPGVLLLGTENRFIEGKTNLTAKFVS